MKKRIMTQIFLLLLCVSWVFAEKVEYKINIDYKTINLTGIDIKGMALNGSIPCPALRFREGDTAKISFHNSMDVPTHPLAWNSFTLPSG
jgi:FtsP/CotA-like multicopper oxidase with cupredoxin domain